MSQELVFSGTKTLYLIRELQRNLSDVEILEENEEIKNAKKLLRKHIRILRSKLKEKSNGFGSVYFADTTRKFVPRERRT